MRLGEHHEALECHFCECDVFHTSTEALIAQRATLLSNRSFGTVRQRLQLIHSPTIRESTKTMSKLTMLAILGLSLTLGCASTTNTVSLKDVTTRKVYAIDKIKILDSMPMFCTKHDFVFQGTEPEVGRVRGYKRMETLHEEEARTILMFVYVTQLKDGRSSVEAKFGYDKIEGTPTKHEESQLADCYIALFRYLDEEVR